MTHSTLAAVSDPATDAFTCIHAGFEAQVARTPSAIALIAPSETLTYRTLNHRANQLAHHLRVLGVGPDTLVALHLTRSAAMVVAFLAVLKAGGAYVPIDPSYPQARRAYLLNDAQAPVLLTETGLLASLPAFAGDCLCLDRDWATIAQHPTHNLPIRTTADSLAYVIYTSGSTGNPKGVLIPHRGLVNHARAMAAAFEMQPCVGAASPQPDRMLQFSSMSFDIIIEEVYPTLISGGCLVLKTDAVAQSIKAFVEFVQHHQVTILNLPTAFWHELVRGMETYPLPTSVRLVVVGGEKASRAMYARWRELVGERVRWLNTYGPTETTVSATLFDPLAAQFDYTHEELPIGCPLPNVTTHILNEQLEPVPLGTGGELYIGGAGLAKGYHRLPAKTAERFVDSPFDARQRLYKTGDLVRQRPDGTIEFLGRADFQVKIRGFRIEPGEIEARLEQHPSIAQQIVIAREDSPGQKRLVAYVVPKAGRANAQEIRDFLAKSLPEYMIPSAFVVLEDLPLTTNGKVDRRSLPEPAYEAGTGAAPETELETQLVGIWQEVLSLPAVGVTDNFFELGGYSLLIARFFNQLERELGYSVPYTLLLEAPTIRELAQRLTATVQLAAPAHPLLVTLAQEGNEPPLFLIHDADGDTSLYLNLAQALGRSVYGLRPRRDAQGNLVHSYLNRMAADYRQAIQTVQPAGPYLVGGLCAGGILAFEVALQLRALEQPVALVALLEAPDVEAIRFSEPSVQDRVVRLWQAWQSGQSGRTQLGHLLQKAASKSVSYLSFTVSSRLQQRSTAISAALFRYYRNHNLAIPTWLRHLSVRDLYLFSEQDYRPEPQFDGPVVLIKASVGEGADQPYQEVYQDPLFGWQQRVMQPVQVAQVPGGHASMLSAEHVAAVASVLTQAIDQAL